MNDQLFRELTDIADEMPATDLDALRTRVGSRSRYLRVRRTVLQSAAGGGAAAGFARRAAGRHYQGARGRRRGADAHHVRHRQGR
jgi:hypothetical protein